MKSKISHLIVLVAGIALLSGCAKDGAVGPQGPQGPPGNANVLSATYIVNNWTSSGNSFWYVSFNVPEITSSVNSGGAVQVFMSLDDGYTWDAVPFTQVNSPYNYYMSFITQPGLIEIDWVHEGGTLGSDPNSYYLATCRFKVVVIPPSARKENVDLTNYEAVKAAYDLKESPPIILK